MTSKTHSVLSWTGKRVLVIGGTQGIGAATALKFAELGASVTITGRNKDLGSNVLGQLESISKTQAPMAFVPFDVSLMSQVHDFTDVFLKESQKQGSKLHALIICAGGLNYGPRRETAEGIELTFSQNVASRFLLTKNLSPIYEKAKIVNCLGAGNGGSVDMDDIQLQKSFSFIKAASQYATINDILAKEFGSRLGPKTGSKFIHFYPGVVNTASVSNQGFPWLIQLGAKMFLPWIADSPSTTAQTIVDIASDKVIDNDSSSESSNFACLGPRGLSVKLPTFVEDHPEAGPVLFEYLEKLTEFKK